MQRREFLGTLAGGVVTTALSSPLLGAEKVYRIGYVGILSGGNNLSAGFVNRLRDLGYSEEKNLKMEWRWLGGHMERLPEVAADLVSLRPDVIIASGSEGALAVQKATTTIPIVVLASHDGVGAGLYKSLAHPGGNITGTDTMSPELDAKRVQIVKEILPQLSRMTVIQNPTIPGAKTHTEVISAAAEKLGIKLDHVEYRTLADVETALQSVLINRSDALFTVTDNIMFQNRKRLADFGLEHRIPIFLEFKESVDLGGLVSYGPDLSEIFHRAAHFVDKILKGEKAGDIPVEQPTKFDLVLNLKTAKALGITIPTDLIVSAQTVIE